MYKHMDFKGIEWLYAQSLPLTATWWATTQMDGIIKTLTLLVALGAGVFFAVMMYYKMKNERIKFMKTKEDENTR